MRLSKPVKLLIGVVTAWPVVYMFVFIAVMGMGNPNGSLSWQRVEVLGWCYSLPHLCDNRCRMRPLAFLLSSMSIVAPLGCENPSQDPPTLRSHLTPRPPAVPEVARAAYYAVFEPIAWSRAEAILRSAEHMWVEETQSGRIYMNDFTDTIERKMVSQLARGVELGELLAGMKRPVGTFKHHRYQQLRWLDAVAMIRGDDPARKVRSIGAMHFGRVFLTTRRGEEFLAIQPTRDALDTLLQQVGRGSFNIVVE